MKDTYVLNHIKELCKQRKWTYYKLAQKADIPYSSLNAMIKHQHIPSIYNLIKICSGFDITLSQFFSNAESNSNDNKETELLNLWHILDENSKNFVLTYMYGLANKQEQKR